MTEQDVDTSRARIHKLHSIGCADYIHLALLARAEKAEAAARTAYARGIQAAHDALVVVPAASIEQEQMAQRCQAAIRALAPDPEERQ